MITADRRSGFLLRTLQQLRAEVHADIDTVSALRALQSRRVAIDTLLDDLDGQLERSERAAVITLVGATGAGKSTLLNVLAGKNIATEGVDRPTTKVATIYAPEDADLHELAAVGGRNGETAHVVRYPAQDSGVGAHVFIDAPDMNSIAGDHAQRVAALAQHSDVLLVVLHRQSVVEAAPVAFLDEFAARRGLAFLLNRTDELSDDSREALREQVEGLARERWGVADAPVVPVSAERAKRDPSGEDRRRLMATVHALVDGQEMHRVRRHNVIGTAAMLASIGTAVSAEVDEELGALAEDLASAIEAFVDSIVSESDERWQLSEASLRQCLWAELARRWDGPSGWLMRLGAVDAAGLGAASLLLRRHPVVAAGLAVGSVATAELRRAREAMSWSAGNPLLPPAEELAQRLHAQFAGYRVRLGRLSAEDAALRAPSFDSVQAHVESAVDGAWRRLIDVDLPRAAESSRLRYLRLPLDAPIYGLVAWLVYQAGLGLVSGAYVGVDLLVNVGLLGAAYLGAVRWFVSVVVRRRSRQLLAMAAGRSRGALDAWRNAAGDDVREQVGDMREALSRLARLDAAWRSRLEATFGRDG